MQRERIGLNRACHTLNLLSDNLLTLLLTFLCESASVYSNRHYAVLVLWARPFFICGDGKKAREINVVCVWNLLDIIVIILQVLR